MRIAVECYSGFKADERPVRFRAGERVYAVEWVLAQWYQPREVCFKVRADDGGTYVLRKCGVTGEHGWTLEPAPGVAAQR